MMRTKRGRKTAPPNAGMAAADTIELPQCTKMDMTMLSIKKFWLNLNTTGLVKQV